MSSHKFLVILTSHSKLGNTGKPTGWYLPEFAHPYKVLAPHAEITVASPAGGEAPLDPSSVEQFKSDECSTKFMTEQANLYKNTVKLESLIGKANQFDGLLVVGGHGPMWDLANDEASQKLIAEFAEAGKIVSAVCHGPAALVNVKLSNGEYLIKDQPVTAFSDAEEEQVGFTEAMPFSLETKLRERGAKYAKAREPWGPHVVVAKSGKLITGQNPDSATPLGEAILKTLKA